MKEPLERFFDKVKVTESCWLWAGATGKGYGRFGVPGRKTVQSHRYLYELVVGPVPTDMDMDHLCRVRACVNPDHLEVVSRSENARRGLLGALRAPTTHCRHGHEYTPANIYLVNRKRKACKECRRIRNAVRYIEVLKPRTAAERAQLVKAL